MRENVEVSTCQRDGDGAIEKQSIVLFQSQPSLLQMINSGEVRELNYMWQTGIAIFLFNANYTLSGFLLR
jgi:hypothetical protein